MSDSIQRPKRLQEEDEDDLLLMQQQFLQTKPSPAATAVRFKGSKTCIQEHKEENDDESKPEMIKDNHDIPMSLDLQIIERDVSHVKVVKPPNISRQSLPAAKRIKEGSSSDTMCEGQSLFAKQFGLRKKQVKNDNLKTPIPSTSILDGSGLGPGGRYEIERIHEDNVNMLSNMSLEDLKEARNQVMTSIDPVKLDFLKKRRQNQGQPKVPSAPIDVEMDLSQDSLPKEVLDNVLANVPLVRESMENKWPNMNLVEKEKLKWMTPLPEEKDTSCLNKEARFNFDGQLMLNMDNPDVKEGLHHHGDDPEKAGYTLSELFTFIESTFPSQKIIGLQTLGKIMALAYRGVFDGVFDTCLPSQLLEGTLIVLQVRRCLDDSNQSVVSAAISCLKGLLCNLELDELHMDRIFTWNLQYIGHDSLYLKLDPRTVTQAALDELKDHELVQKDPIIALIKRTDLLPRLRYLLDNTIRDQDDPVIVKNVISILIRVSRHSEDSCYFLYNTPYLMETIITNFIRPKIPHDQDRDKFYGNPYFPALKLLRVMCSQSSRVAKGLLSKFGHDLLPSLQVYLTLDPTTMSRSSSTKVTPSNLLEVSIESLRFYCVLLNTDLKPVWTAAADSLTCMFPIVLKQMQYALSMSALAFSTSSSTSIPGAFDGGSQFDWQFSSVLISCLNLFHKKINSSSSSPTTAFTPLIESIVFQWMTQLINQCVVPSSLDISTAISAGIHFLLRDDVEEEDPKIKSWEENKQTSIRDSSSSFSSKILVKFLIPMMTSGTTAHLMWIKLINKLITRSSLMIEDSTFNNERHVILSFFKFLSIRLFVIFYHCINHCFKSNFFQVQFDL